MTIVTLAERAGEDPWHLELLVSVEGSLPPIQYWFTGTALATFLALLAALSTLGYGWYRAAITELESSHNKIESAAQKAKKERVKDLLGKALTAGTDLILRFALGEAL